METVSGIIERVTFHNAENGFAVLRVQVQGKRDLATVVGKIASVHAGEFVDAKGQWVTNREHGRQFQAETLKTTSPRTTEGIEKYLGSGMVKGIGPHYAKKIVKVFGERTLDIIDESPSFLKQIKGLGPKRIQRIRESWKQQKAVRDIMIFLQSHGIGTARAVRIYKTYGDQAIDMVRSNPYRLAEDIWGIGFDTADQLADKMGVDRNSPFRARAALQYVLQDLSHKGHCGYPQSAVMKHTHELTGIEPKILDEAVEFLIGEQQFFRETWEFANRDTTSKEPWLFLRDLYFAETGVAEALTALQKLRHPMPRIDVDVALEWVQDKMKLTLAPMQQEAIRKAVTSKILVITGGPGVGKTTLVRGILDIFEAKHMRCALCAPTGRAAKRLSESTGREAKTIHRLLEFDPTSGRSTRFAERPLEADLVLVDESSMVDIHLMKHLIQAVPDNACLVLVGDVDQLPSVGPGNVLADIIRSGEFPVSRLTEIFRQAEASNIVRAAHQVHHGEMPISGKSDQLTDFYLIEADTPEAIQQTIVTLIRDRIPARFGLDPIRDIQLLTPMNRSELGSRHLNAKLQEIFNTNVGMGEVTRFGWTFRVGDKVLQTVNDYGKEVFNGDIGRITNVDEQESELTVDFDGRAVTYDFGELDELALAYALTIHKSQGSEYAAVVIPLHTQHYVMLQRNLLYTGITRGKKLVVLVGSRKALGLAVGRQDNATRCTALAQRLRRSADEGK